MLDEDPAPLPKRGHSPYQFSVHFYCGQMAGCIKMPLGMDVGLSPGDFVLDGEPAPLPDKRAEPPKFSAHVYCGQMAGWIKMPLGMEVGLGLPTLHCVRCGPGYPQKKGTPAPTQFLAHVILWPNGWMDEDTAWYGSRHQRRPHCIRRVPSAPRKGHSTSRGHGRPSQLLLSSCFAFAILR